MIFYVTPSDPARLAAGQGATPEDVQRVAERLHLDEPVWQQYGRFLWQLVGEQSLGESFVNRQDVNDIVLRAAPVTAALVFGGAIFWLTLSIPIGIISALRPRSLVDRAGMVFVLIGLSAHPVWIGLIFAYFIGFKLELTPITGYADFFNPSQEHGGPVQWAYHMLLPWSTFAILFAALYVRLIRANVMETMNEDYVRTARAKGAPERQVIRSHILRNSMLPIVTILGMDIGIALGGAIFTESIYSLPGLGQTGAAELRELRPARDPGDRRLLDPLHHHHQPDRRPALRRRRPADPTHLMAFLEVRELRTSFRTDDGIVKAVDGVSFSVEKGKTLGIVGESGCGKSVTCLDDHGAEQPAQHDLRRARRSSTGDDLLQMSPRKLRALRGNDIAMIFQDPMTSLNPVHTIGKQLVEAVMLHRDVTTRDAKLRALELLKAVGIPRADSRIDDYPHQFSGGMRQRVMIAMALINEPDLLIADEPTTALDVTTQAQILGLMTSLQEEFETAIIMITHDLGVVAEIADDVVVMYAGKVAEEGSVDEIFTRPHHPYTWGLLGSLPRLDADVDRLVQIQGSPPSLLNPPRGCRFHPRCPYVLDVCNSVVPELLPVLELAAAPSGLPPRRGDEGSRGPEARQAGTLAEAS